jgi:hypothetical protein
MKMDDKRYTQEELARILSLTKAEDAPTAEDVLLDEEAYSSDLEAVIDRFAARETALIGADTSEPEPHVGDEIFRYALAGQVDELRAMLTRHDLPDWAGRLIEKRILQLDRGEIPTIALDRKSDATEGIAAGVRGTAAAAFSFLHKVLSIEASQRGRFMTARTTSPVEAIEDANLRAIGYEPQYKKQIKSLSPHQVSLTYLFIAKGLVGATHCSVSCGEAIFVEPIVDDQVTFYLPPDLQVEEIGFFVARGTDYA